MGGDLDEPEAVGRCDSREVASALEEDGPARGVGKGGGIASARAGVAAGDADSTTGGVGVGVGAAAAVGVKLGVGLGGAATVSTAKLSGEEGENPGESGLSSLGVAFISGEDAQ